MYNISKKFRWSMAHRLTNGYKGKCKNIHGHEYVAEFVFETEMLDEIGFVIDFAELQEKLGKWIDKYLDHSFLVKEDDIAVINFLQENDFKHYRMVKNTTAENIAQLLYEMAQNEYYRVEEVRVWETPDSMAIYK